MDSKGRSVDLDETAEGYVMGMLTAQQVIAFENHYVECARCAALLQETAK